MTKHQRQQRACPYCGNKLTPITDSVNENVKNAVFKQMEFKTPMLGALRNTLDTMTPRDYIDATDAMLGALQNDGKLQEPDFPLVNRLYNRYCGGK